MSVRPNTLREVLDFLQRVQSWEEGKPDLHAVKLQVREAIVAEAAQPVAWVPKEWRDALRKLAFMARTSGGTAGPDAGLMAALDEAEALLRLPYNYPAAQQAAQPQQATTQDAQPVAWTAEHHFALREAYSIGSADDYFKVWPIHDNDAGRMLFERGFVRGFDCHDRLYAQPQQATGTEAAVCNDIRERQAFGITKYGTTVRDNPLPLRQWLQHAYEECLDQAVYLKRAMEEMDKKT